MTQVETSTAAAVPVLDVHDVTVAYHRKPVIWDVDLTINTPQLVGIVGPNGAGKSTLIKAILGLVPMASGRVSIYGKPFRRQRRLVGYVPQRESVDWDFPVSVFEAVLMGTYGELGWLRRGAGENRGGDGIVRRLEFLAPLKVSMLSERREAYAPFGLSGGEDGTRGRNQLQRAGSDETIDLGGKFAIDVQPGDILTIETPGGGGYGKSVNDEL